MGQKKSEILASGEICKEGQLGDTKPVTEKTQLCEVQRQNHQHFNSNRVRILCSNKFVDNLTNIEVKAFEPEKLQGTQC